VSQDTQWTSTDRYFQLSALIDGQAIPPDHISYWTHKPL